MSERRGRDQEYERNERTARSCHRMSKGWLVRNHCAVVQHLLTFYAGVSWLFSAFVKTRGKLESGEPIYLGIHTMRLIVKRNAFPPDKSKISYRCHATFQLNGNISWAGNEVCKRRKTDQRFLLGGRKNHVLPLSLRARSLSRSILCLVSRNSAITVCTLNSRALV